MPTAQTIVKKVLSSLTKLFEWSNWYACISNKIKKHNKKNPYNNKPHVSNNEKLIILVAINSTKYKNIVKRLTRLYIKLKLTCIFCA